MGEFATEKRKAASSQKQTNSLAEEKSPGDWPGAK
jgi:hypothetical protein